MFRHYRQRRGPYALAEPSRAPSFIGRIVVLVVALLIVYVIGKWLLGLLGIGRDEQNAKIALLAEDGGTVSVSLDNGLMQHAQSEMSLLTGDKVSTGNDGFASLTFADGTRMRMDEQSEAEITESILGSEESRFRVTLNKGNTWVQTPSSNTLSGTIIRTITVGDVTYSFPANTEALVRQNAVLVFSGDGNGVDVSVKNISQTFSIGEGQQWTLPSSGTVTGDPREAAVWPEMKKKRSLSHHRPITKL